MFLTNDTSARYAARRRRESNRAAFQQRRSRGWLGAVRTRRVA